MFASPLVADGKIDIFDRAGHSTVVKAGPEFGLLAADRIEGDRSFYIASPLAAVSHCKLFVRSSLRGTS